MQTKEEKVASDKAYNKANKEERSAYHKAYNAANKEEIKAKSKVYYEAHKEELVAYSKAYYDSHKKEKVAYREANKEEISDYQKGWYVENIEKVRRSNAERMTVNGKYVSKKHPLWKIGNYKSFNDAAFSSFVNYSKSTNGFVYAIKNKAWPEWVKVGKAGDAEDRLKGYQTGDPFRDYTLEFSFKVPNRHTAETEAHKALALLSEDRRNEWFKVDLTTAVRCIEAINE